MQQHQNSIASLFAQISTATNTQTILQAQKSLALLAENPNFVINIVSLLKQQSLSEFGHQIKLSASVYLRQISRKILASKDQGKINILCENLMSILRDTNVILEYKKHAADAISILIEADKNRIIKKAFIPNIIDILERIKKEPLAQYDYYYLGLFGQLIVEKPTFSGESIQYVNITLIEFANICVMIENQVSILLLESKNIQEINSGLELLHLYTRLMVLYGRSFLYTQQKIVKAVAQNQIFPILISRALNLSLPTNKLQILVFTEANQAQAAKLLNSIKTNVIKFMHSCIVLLEKASQDPQTFSKCHFINESKTYIPLLIGNSSNLLEKISILNLQKSISKTFHNILKLLILCSHTNHFYQILLKEKENLIGNIIFRILIFDDKDINTFNDSPQQFVNFVIRVANAEEKDMKKDKNFLREEQEEETDDITLKQAAALLLKKVCRYQDGTLVDIFSNIVKALRNQIKIGIPDSSLLFCLSILKPLLIERPNLVITLYQLIVDTIKGLDIPLQEDLQEKIQKNLTYTMCMVNLATFISEFNSTLEDEESMIQATIKTIKTILNNHQSHEVCQLLSHQIIMQISQLPLNDSQQHSIPALLNILNNELRQKEQIPKNLLQSLQKIIKHQNYNLRQYYDIVLDLAKICIGLIQKEMNKQQRFNKHKLHTCWNIIDQITDINCFLPQSLQDIQQAILPLLKYINSSKYNSEHVFEQQFLGFFIKFLLKNKQISVDTLTIFQSIPVIFYTKFNKKFGKSFHAIQLFIHFGKDIIGNTPSAIKVIIEMCRSSLQAVGTYDYPYTELDYCQAVLILHSLIIECGKYFDETVWIQIAKILHEKFAKSKNIKGFLKANMIAALALVIAGGHSSFKQQDLEFHISKVFTSFISFNIQYSSKVFIIASCQFLHLISYKSIRQHYPIILGCIITLLERTTNLAKFSIKDNEDEQQMQYSQKLQMIFHSVKNMDQYKYFQQKVSQINSPEGKELLNRAQNELPEAKKKFLKDVLSTVRVSGQPRRILKIKKSVENQMIKQE